MYLFFCSQIVVGLTRLELVTPRLSSVCSNLLSYRPSDTSYEEQLVVDSCQSSIFRSGGDPAAGSPTATLLRLHPSHLPHRGQRPPCGLTAYFWCNKLPWCDGRCVQGPGTYSPRHSDPRLLAIPTSWSRVADSNPDYDRLFEISILSLGSNPLYRPL